MAAFTASTGVQHPDFSDSWMVHLPGYMVITWLWSRGTLCDNQSISHHPSSQDSCRADLPMYVVVGVQQLLTRFWSLRKLDDVRCRNNNTIIFVGTPLSQMSEWHKWLVGCMSYGGVYFSIWSLGKRNDNPYKCNNSHYISHHPAFPETDIYLKKNFLTYNRRGQLRCNFWLCM